MKNSLKVIVVIFIIVLFASKSFATGDVQSLFSPIGTFVIGKLDDNNEFLLDTKTGKVWQFVYDEDHNASLVKVPVLDKAEYLKEKGTDKKKGLRPSNNRSQKAGSTIIFSKDAIDAELKRRGIK